MNSVDENTAFGCIPYKQTSYGTMLLMVLNTDGEDHWEFPKGRAESGETGEETALRELKEETGLEGKLAQTDPIEFSYEYEYGANRIQKNIKYFFCEVSQDSEVIIQPGEIGSYIWLGLDEIEKKATYPKMKEAARKVSEHFSQ